MLILILIDVQYLQKVVVNFEEGSNGQNHCSGSTPPPLLGGIPPTTYSYLENPGLTFLQDDNSQTTYRGSCLLILYKIGVLKIFKKVAKKIFSKQSYCLVY